MIVQECEFVSGVRLSERIREVCRADAVDCAVAFWGQGMRDALFPRWPNQKVRIVCDISMRATTKAALRELGATSNRNLTVRDGLHAKLYISIVGAVVCSANASANGVGAAVGKAGRLIEMGVFCPPKSEAFTQANAAFADLFDPTCRVTEADIDRAPEQSREPRPFARPDEYAGLPLLQRLRRYPEAFEGVRVVIANTDLNETLATERLDQANATGTFEQEQTWDNIVVQGDRGEVGSIPRLMLVIFRPADRRQRTVTGYIDARPFPPTRPDTVFGRQNWPHFSRAIGQPDLKKGLSTAEWTLVDRLLENEKWLFTPDEFAAALNRLADV